jgi:hypothetical protein
MATTTPFVSATCPLCGASILSVNQRGRVESESLHAVAVGRWGNSGYGVCDGCGVLTNLPANLTLN